MAVIDRESRGLNRLDPKLTKADTALNRFGKFYAQNYPINPGMGPDGLFVEGWATQTLLGRVIEFGNQGAAQPGSGPTTIPAIIVLVDRIYAKFEPRRKLVILSVYAYKRNHPQVVQRRWTQLSDEVFRSELRIAREIVCHALELYRPE